MTGDEQKRHCQKCQTHVHNLTGMSDLEIMHLRKKNGGKLCGAFRLGPGIAKPLALGSGIASLALASCTPEPLLVGMLPPAEYSGTGNDDSEPDKKDYATPPPSGDQSLVAGMICVPEPKRGEAH